MLRRTLTVAAVAALAMPFSDAQAQQTNRLLGSGVSGSIQSVSAPTVGVPIIQEPVQQPEVVVESDAAEATPAPAPAVTVDANCPSCEPMMQCAPACESSLDFGGWIQTGYHSNNTGLFNDRPDNVNLHQLWFYLEKEAARECYWDLGFRMDVMYGTDASKTQAFGNPAGTWDYQNGLDYDDYGWALPQLYAELARDRMSIKLGHFYTLVGYEVVTAPDNFFYSHAYTMFNSEPFTHTGAIASYDLTDSTTLYSGWTLGWDTGFNQLNGGSNFLGGFSKGLGDNATFTYISTAGNLGWRGSGYTHSAVMDFNLTDNLNYVFQSDLVSTDSSGGNNNEVGINQYLLYTISDQLAAGTRMEWWKSDISGTTQSTYALTSGLNIKPSENLIIRPEVRYNWGADLVGADMETPIFGIDAIVTF